MQTHELLDRFEILYPDSNISELRRAYIDKDLSSIFKIITDENKDDLRKLIIEDNTWKLWPLLDSCVDSQFTAAFKSFFINETEIWDDCFSRGQLKSKLWIIKELTKLNLDLGTVFLCAGWYATLATMLFESDIAVDKVRSFDIDPTVGKIAKVFNKPWLMDDWKFQTSTQDIHSIDYNNYTFSVSRSNGTQLEITESADTIINTSCEHISNFTEWYAKIPDGKLVILQSNDFFEVDEHVNCSIDIDDFSRQTPLKSVLYSNSLQLEKYTRYMRIGYK
jgi:hypothetical protein